jgi:hypothetical protein
MHECGGLDDIRAAYGWVHSVKADLLHSWGWPSSGLRALPLWGFSAGGASGIFLPSTGTGLWRAADRGERYPVIHLG